MVVGRTFAVLVRERNRLEIACGGQCARIKGRIVGQFGDRDEGKLAADLHAFGRIVVEEHERVDADVEGRGNRPQIGRLVRPVSLKDGDMILTQEHVRMIAEGKARVVLVVLAADRKNDASRPKLQRHPLYGKKGFARGGSLAELDSCKPVVANHAAPKRVIEVKHQALPRKSAGRRNSPRYDIAVDRQKRGCEAHL